jgi:hypothetical protein
MQILCDITEMCSKCKGRKEMYKLNNTYTLVDMGAKKVKCPVCLGKGKMKKFTDEEKKEIISNINKLKQKNNTENIKKRGRPKKITKELGK